MKRFNQRSGFTLIEIIIVVVILGILAAVALPRLTENINKSKAAEAFNMGAAVGRAYDRCLADQSGGAAVTTAHTNACRTPALLNINIPASTNFTHLVAAPANSDILYYTATLTGGTAGTDIVWFTYSGASGGMTRGCGGQLANMCK
jgi:prepilin-type N-terminal cleavage/methylation domain-containing protein